MKRQKARVERLLFCACVPSLGFYLRMLLITAALGKPAAWERHLINTKSPVPCSLPSHLCRVADNKHFSVGGSLLLANWRLLKGRGVGGREGMPQLRIKLKTFTEYVVGK